MNTVERDRRLAEIAKKMKTAKGKQLEALNREVDRLIGFDSGDDHYDPERDADWQIANRGG